LSQDIIESMDAILPDFWSRRNPIDLVGKVDPEVYRRGLEVLLSSDNYDVVFALGCLGSSEFIVRLMASDLAAKHLNKNFAARALDMAQEMERIYNRDVGRLMATFHKPVVLVSLSDTGKMAHETEDGFKIVTYRTPERGVRVLQKLVEYGKFLARA
jgi:acyl-CoA synthetase (NDP forming)